MPDLTIQVQEVKGLSGTALVVLAGSIDAKTVITFQTHLNSVKDRGIHRFIMDMEAVKYVNSTGLGYLINLADSVTEKGGISLVKVQPKVKVVFDMLGLNAFFRIFATREDAIKHLNEAAHPSSPNDQTVVLQTRPTAPPASPPTPRPAPPVVEPPRHAFQEAHHQPPVTARHVVAAPASTAGGGSSETIHIECQACKALLAVKDVGTYKCPRCLTPFSYAGAGKVSFLPRQKALPVQLSLNFSPECTEGLLEFVRKMSQKSGFTLTGIADLQAAVRDTVDVIKRHSYGGNENNVYHVLMMSVDTELEIRFADYGTSLNGGGEMFASLKRATDRFELRNNPRGGNVVTVSRKAR